jgi:hypothetical protein
LNSLKALFNQSYFTKEGGFKVEVQKQRMNTVAEGFINKKLSMGIVSLSLSELMTTTGLSLIDAKKQLLRFGEHVTRVSPRRQYFLIVTMENRVVDTPPVEQRFGDYYNC